METRQFVKELSDQLEQEEQGGQKRKSGRPRSMTVLKLQWLAERARKCMHIKAKLEDGKYSVDSKKVAKAILNVD